jgi:hypothetical protein
MLQNLGTKLKNWNSEIIVCILFIKEKQVNYGVRFNADIASFCEVPISLPNTIGKFWLLSLSLYMVEELSRLVNL